MTINELIVIYREVSAFLTAAPAFLSRKWARKVSLARRKNKAKSKIEKYSKNGRQNANNHLILKFPIYVASFCAPNPATNRHSEPGFQALFSVFLHVVYSEF